MKPILAFAIAASLFAANPAHAHNTPAEEANMALVLRFYDAVVNAKDVAAARALVGEQYIQHNPQAADGVAGMEQFIAFLQRSFPDARSEVVRSFVDGDHVILHVHSVRVPGERGRAIMEIFRVSEGKVVEHWDVIQDVPKHPSTPTRCSDDAVCPDPPPVDHGCTRSDCSRSRDRNIACRNRSTGGR